MPKGHDTALDIFRQPTSIRRRRNEGALYDSQRLVRTLILHKPSLQTRQRQAVNCPYFWLPQATGACRGYYSPRLQQGLHLTFAANLTTRNDKPSRLVRAAHSSLSHLLEAAS